MKTRRPRAAKAAGKKQQRKGTEEEKDVEPESARGSSDDSDEEEFVPKEGGEESEDDNYAEEGKTKQTKKQAFVAVDDQEARTQYQYGFIVDKIKATMAGVGVTPTDVLRIANTSEFRVVAEHITKLAGKKKNRGGTISTPDGGLIPAAFERNRGAKYKTPYKYSGKSVSGIFWATRESVLSCSVSCQDAPKCSTLKEHSLKQQPKVLELHSQPLKMQTKCFSSLLFG